MEAAIILTYRCVCKCYMCNIWKYPTDPAEEIKPEHIEKLPDNLAFCNLTGGEPFLRDDIEEIVDIVMRKSRRVVISTNGWFTEKIVNIAKKYPKIGIRVSLEGLPAANDELRGMKDGFDHGLRTLLELQRIGCKDIGFGITVSDRNAKDMIELYQLAKGLGFEFATAVTHNSYYFHKYDNTFKDPKMIEDCFRELIKELLRTKRIKNWFRAYFNYGLIRKVRGQPRLLPCEAGTENFFVTPFGEVVPLQWFS
ncbi:MAG: Radical SAM superfamily maturase [Thermodesulfobacteria bacterium]|nr:Radical SAM superfamily maturase [Thermodesulfobacteriota bacterium]